MTIKREKAIRDSLGNWSDVKSKNMAASLVPKPRIEMGSNSTMIITGASKANLKKDSGRPNAMAQK